MLARSLCTYLDVLSHIYAISFFDSSLGFLYYSGLTKLGAWQYSYTFPPLCKSVVRSRALFPVTTSSSMSLSNMLFTLNAACLRSLTGGRERQ